ncbi:MAG: peptidase [Myxacorys californica WJT36-NPBG1]|nr:peptidase [Myxacorys californica WJT36-NPBG1]
MNWIGRRINRLIRTHLSAIFCGIGCVFLLSMIPAISAERNSVGNALQASTGITALPAAQRHPLPPTLAQWRSLSERGNYFERVERTPPEYLVWSEFPIKVYIDARQGGGRSQVWVEAVKNAIAQWSVYLPLTTVAQAQDADITIVRSAPPIRFPPVARVRSAETRFELYTKGSPGISYHRCSIFIQPSQADVYLLAAARHELGHALGIWGHSRLETDAMYFSQVRDPLPISERDVNTLKRVYEQPTRLGWKVSKRE